jgi:hypothetical protein
MGKTRIVRDWVSEIIQRHDILHDFVENNLYSVPRSLKTDLTFVSNNKRILTGLFLPNYLNLLLKVKE